MDFRTKIRGTGLAHLVLDWLLVPPGRGFVVARSLWWLIFPAVYLVYSLVRGPIVDWYPYPFVDPRPRGYPHVVTMSVGIAVAFGLAALAIGWAGARRAGARA